VITWWHTFSVSEQTKPMQGIHVQHIYQNVLFLNWVYLQNDISKQRQQIHLGVYKYHALWRIVGMWTKLPVRCCIVDRDCWTTWWDYPHCTANMWITETVESTVYVWQSIQLETFDSYIYIWLLYLRDTICQFHISLKLPNTKCRSWQTTEGHPDVCCVASISVHLFQTTLAHIGLTILHTCDSWIKCQKSLNSAVTCMLFSCPWLNEVIEYHCGVEYIHS
jgi:hypothetical protein